MLHLSSTVLQYINYTVIITYVPDQIVRCPYVLQGSLQFCGDLAPLHTPELYCHPAKTIEEYSKWCSDLLHQLPLYHTIQNFGRRKIWQVCGKLQEICQNSLVQNFPP